MNDTTKLLIDSLTYTDMLRRWRHAPAGDPMFIGEVGTYFSKVMQEKKLALDDASQVAASKKVGWD